MLVVILLELTLIETEQIGGKVTNKEVTVVLTMLVSIKTTWFS